jgi:hypothetical protein
MYRSIATAAAQIVEGDGNAGACDAEARKRPDAEDERRRKRDEHCSADKRHQRRNPHVADPAKCGGPKIDDPDRRRRKGDEAQVDQC